MGLNRSWCILLNSAHPRQVTLITNTIFAREGNFLFSRIYEGLANCSAGLSARSAMSMLDFDADSWAQLQNSCNFDGTLASPQKVATPVAC